MNLTVEWGKYQDAYKAIWEKLDALTKALDSLALDALRVKTV
jgi:hypothetical protein